MMASTAFNGLSAQGKTLFFGRRAAIDADAAIFNRTGFPHAWFEDTGPSGQVYDVLAVRGTFDFPEKGDSLLPAEWQTPILWGDELDGPEDNPLRMVLLREGDTALYKPRADLQITGSARSEDGKPRRWWEASVVVSAANGKVLHKKALGLSGPRRFARGMFGWRVSQSEAVADVALDYRHAFGGSFSVPAGEDEGERTPRAVYKPDNPAGCGWLPDAKALGRLSKRARQYVQAQVDALREMPAPQIETIWGAVTSPDSNNRRAAQGFGPVVRWCEPRVRLAGTYDAQWRRERCPQLPKDFDLASTRARTQT
jgi:hypothetical protein